MRITLPKVLIVASLASVFAFDKAFAEASEDAKKPAATEDGDFWKRFLAAEDLSVPTSPPTPPPTSPPTLPPTKPKGTRMWGGPPGFVG